MISRPTLSVVLAANDLEETAATRACLRRQSVASRLELVLVLPEALAVEEGELFHRLWGGQVVRLPQLTSVGTANAAGVRAARADLVVLTEDHVFPHRDWAESLIADHGGPWAAVGPQVRNANPATKVSWADFVIGYGPWSRSEAAGEATLLPGHNTSYRRQTLLDYEDDLETMLGAETLLHWDLVRRGRRLMLSRNAVIRHLNFARWSVFRRVQLLNGRTFAARRSASWSVARRVGYVVGSPLIPMVRLWRYRDCFGLGGGPGGMRAPWSSLPAVFLGLCLDACGQAVGYARGRGEMEADLVRYEFGRSRFVLPGEPDAAAAAASLEGA